MFKTKSRVIVTAAIAAMWLTACGGGGGGDPVAAAPTPTNPGSGAPGEGSGAPAPAPAQALSWAAQATAAAQPYHTVSMSAGGDVMVAAGNAGRVLVSTGGDNWVDQATLPTARWVTSDVDATGSTIFAAAFDGQLYRWRSDTGTWVQVDRSFNPDAAGGGLGLLAYESVAVSGNGQRVLAGIQGSALRFSTDGGDTWGVPLVPVGTSTQWRAVDVSTDGTSAIAVNHDNEVLVGSVDALGVLTFSRVNVVLPDGTAVTDGWYRAALSGDGNTIVVVGSTRWGPGGSSGIYVGRRNAADNTWTWNQGSTVAGNYGGVAISADGGVIAASIYQDADPFANPSAPGQVLVSTNRGTSFSAATAPSATEVNYRSIAMDALATRLLVGAGEFSANAFAGANGSVYVSSGAIAGQ